jgi:hypothetical protein
MAVNEKISEALKGNTNAAKNHAKKGIAAIQNASNRAKVVAGGAFANTAKKLDKFNDKAIDVRQSAAYAAGAAVGAPIGAIGGAALGLSATRGMDKTDKQLAYRTLAVGATSFMGAVTAADYLGKKTQRGVNSLNEYPEKARQSLKNKLNSR